MQAKRCKNVTNRVFLKEPSRACSVGSALYVPIDKIKEQRDESGSEAEGARKRGAKKGMLYVFDELLGD